jgi:mono/diheme cytochrome c family protein
MTPHDSAVPAGSRHEYLLLALHLLLRSAGYRRARTLAAAGFAILLSEMAPAAPGHTAQAADGVPAVSASAGGMSQAWTPERLYRDGIGSDGQAVQGDRPGGTSLSGAAAACVNCHRRSGLGTAEGKSVVPPISGDYLFQARTTNMPQGDLPPTQGVGSGPGGVTHARTSYDDQTLARAVRDGLGSGGQTLSVLMPRYALGDRDMQALIGYLRTLGTGAVPGVGDDTLHFATIITPEADSQAREGMLATLQQFFHDRNHIIAGSARPMSHNEHGVLFRVTRRWELHVWELSGQPAEWPEQLRRHFAAEPVFAVISGAGGEHWAPVHDFCEASRLPCLFPNVDQPIVNEGDFFPVYYSRGVFLEADLLAEGMADNALGAAAAPRLLQVVRKGNGGEAAARQLEQVMLGRGWQVTTRVLASDEGGGALAAALEGSAGSALALWLTPPDLALLPPRPPRLGRVWLSGLLGGLEAMPLPEAWRRAAEISYPFELPQQRALAMKLPEGWFKIKQLALVSPRVQMQTYLACQILSETLGELHTSFVPEYLVERLEVMLSHRRFNVIFPRLSLGVGQRFASKGGYLAHFAGPQQLLADGDWRIP